MAKKLAPFSALQKAKDYIDSKLNTKVDKVSGKGLSTNDYTTTEKNKLSGIASGAEVNVQSDWNQSTTTADDYIKNKPSSLPASDVYAWAKASTKPSYSASEVGLGNVGNFKAVSTVANQGLSDTEKANAVANIDALPKWCDQYNGYIKQCSGNGQYDYYKIGTVKITSAYVNYPLVLEISGRGRPYTTLHIMYNHSTTADPDLGHFRSDNNSEFYIKKIDTSTWDIFGVYFEKWGNAILHRVTGSIPEGLQFTIGMTNAGSIPSDATKATYWGHSLQADILTNFENNNVTGKNANDVTVNAHTYYTSNGPSKALGASENDGALYTQAYSSSWVAQIAQDYRNGRLFVRGKKNGTWQDWKRIAITGESQPASDVYAWAKASTKPSYSASEVGLGNVGNFKAVSTVANQGLSTTEKQNARNNIDIHVGQYSASTVDAIYTDLVKGKGIFFGSTELSGDSVLPSTWYNFQWIPHRDGTAEGDNANFGNFIFYSMISTSKIYVVRFTNGRRAETIEIPKKTDIPTKVSQLTNDSGYTTNTGTITGITMNGASKGTSGVVDLGTVLTQHQDISGKVDKISGKGLSTNDYTTTEKNKLAGIASGAEVNVQPDWNQSTTTADDYIKNKPSSMPASDVYAWAKASTKPTYTASEVGLGNVGNFKAVSTVANQGLSGTEKANARDNIGAASDSLATTSVKGLMSPDDKNTLNVLNARHKIRVITAQNSYDSSTGKSTVTFTLNPNNLDGYGKFYRVSSVDSTGFGCMFTFHCFAGGLNISSDKLTPNCTMTTSGNPGTGLVVTLVSTEGVGYSGQFRVKIETINY